MMNRAYFNKKYAHQIAEIAKVNNVDLSVGSDMFISNIKNAFNVCYEAAGECSHSTTTKGFRKNMIIPLLQSTICR